MRLAKIIPTLCLSSLVLALAACDSGPSVSASNATPAEVQAKLDAAGGTEAMVKPGRWEGTTTVHQVEIPGMPPEVQAQMKSQMGTPQTFISCVTEEDVKDRKGFFTGNPDEKTCKYENFDMADGKLSATLKCDRGAEGRMAMTMNGNYAPETYSMELDSKAEGNGPMGSMNMKMSVQAKRTGICKGDENAAPQQPG